MKSIIKFIKQAVISALVWLGLAALLIGMIMTGIQFFRYMNSDNGIYPTDDGEAVYLHGEACIVNMTYDRTESEIMSNMVFCLKKHSELK